MGVIKLRGADRLPHAVHNREREGRRMDTVMPSSFVRSINNASAGFSNALRTTSIPTRGGLLRHRLLG
jgi:hypothetical protein